MNKPHTRQASQPNPLTPKQPSRHSQKHKRRREAALQREAEQRRATRTRRLVTGSIIVAVLITAVVSLYFVAQTHANPQNQAEPGAKPAYSPIDGIACNQMEQAVFHIHAHLSLYIDGQAVAIPQGIGIAPDGSCFYWLHTHDASGVIHIEAPANRTFTLGNFLDIWRQQFSELRTGYPPELDQPGGPGWQIWVNGKPSTGDFHTMVLQPHLLITLAYNSPGVKPDTTYTWNGL